MATAPLIITDPIVASPAVFAATAHANDNLHSWTEDRRAKLLLASCAASMPHGEWHRAYHAYGYGEGFRYIGYRVDALTAIRDEHGQRALDLYHAEGDPAYAVFALHCQSASVTDAIDAACEAALAAKMEG